MKKLSIAIITLIMVFSMASCGGNNNNNNTAASDNTAATENTAANADVTVFLDIDFPDDSNVKDIDDVKLTVKNGSSVLDVLNTYANENNIDVTMDESSADPYVTGINGVTATESAGWAYEVNDEMVMEAANKCTVKANDEINWEFETWQDTND